MYTTTQPTIKKKSIKVGHSSTISGIADGRTHACTHTNIVVTQSFFWNNFLLDKLWQRVLPATDSIMSSWVCQGMQSSTFISDSAAMATERKHSHSPKSVHTSGHRCATTAAAWTLSLRVVAVS